MKFLTDELRIKANLVWEQLNGVEYVYEGTAPTPEEADKKSLSVNAISLIDAANRKPHHTKLELYQDAGLTPGQGKVALNHLIAGGYVKEHVIVTHHSGSGNQGVFLEILENGKNVLKQRKIIPAEPRIRKSHSFAHSDVYPRRIEDHEKAQGSKVSFDVTFGAKCFDVLAIRDGKYFGYEIALSGNKDWNASQLAKAAAVVGIEQVICVSDNEKFMDGIKAEVEKLNCKKEKIQFVFVSEFFKKEV